MWILKLTSCPFTKPVFSCFIIYIQYIFVCIFVYKHTFTNVFICMYIYILYTFFYRWNWIYDGEHFLPDTEFFGVAANFDQNPQRAETERRLWWGFGMVLDMSTTPRVELKESGSSLGWEFLRYTLPETYIAEQIINVIFHNWFTIETSWWNLESALHATRMCASSLA